MTARPSSPLGGVPPEPDSPAGIPLENNLVEAGVLTASQWAWALYESAETPLTVSEICLAHGWADPMELYPHLSTQLLGLGDILILTRQITPAQWQAAIEQIQFALGNTPNTGIPAWAEHLLKQGQLSLAQIHSAITRQAQLRLHPQPNALTAMSRLANQPSPPDPTDGSLAGSLYTSLEDLQPLYWSVQNAQLHHQENSLQLQTLAHRNQDLAQQVDELATRLQQEISVNQQLQEQIEIQESIKQEQVTELQHHIQEALAQFHHQQDANQTLLRAHNLDQQRIHELEKQLRRKEEQAEKQQHAIRLLKEQVDKQTTQNGQLQAELTTSRSEEKRMRAERTALQEQISLLETDVEQLKGWIQRLQEQPPVASPTPDQPQMQALREDYEALLLQFNALQATRTEQEERIRQIQMNQDLLEMEVEQRRDYIQRLEADLATAQQERERLEHNTQQRIRFYESQIEDIQQQLQREINKREDLMAQLLRLQRLTQSDSSDQTQPMPILTPEMVANTLSRLPSSGKMLLEQGMRDPAEIELELDSVITGFEQATPWIRRILSQLYAIDLLSSGTIQTTLNTWHREGGTFTDVLARSAGLKPETVKFFGDGGFGARLMGARTVEDFLVASGLVTRFQIEQVRRDVKGQSSGSSSASICHLLSQQGILTPLAARYFAQTFGTAGSGSRPKDWEV